MKLKNVCESILAGAVSALFSYYVLSVPATLTATAIRRKIPDAWLSGLIVWYAHVAVIAASAVIAGIACGMVYKHATQGPRVKIQNSPLPARTIRATRTSALACFAGQPLLRAGYVRDFAIIRETT